MQHILFDPPDLSYLKTAILIKTTGLNRIKLETNYIKPTKQNNNKFIAFDLSYGSVKKVSASHAKEYLSELLPELKTLNIKTLLVADSNYFKYLTGNTKSDPFYGEIVSCNIPDYKMMRIILIPNYQALVYNPMLQGKLDRSLKALTDHMDGVFKTPGEDIIKTAIYPETPKQISDEFNRLLQYPALTCDIEALSLNFWEAGISTIGFAWNKHECSAFAIDRSPYPVFARDCLKQFLETYKGTLIYHNAGYDLKVLTYELWMKIPSKWMKNLSNYVGMQEGIEILTKNFDDTKLIAYTATNNAIENILGLKELSAEFTGNYAEDITDTSKIALPDLLEYNGRDALATWFVYKKYKPIMIEDQQEDLYKNLMKPSVKSLLAMELCGMPINPKRVQEAKNQLSTIVATHMDFFKNNHQIKEFHYQLLEAKAVKFTAKAKKKIYAINDPVILKDLEMFNPGSDDQTRGLLYEFFGLPVLDLTKGKQPSVGKKTIDKLINHTTDPEIIEVLENLRGVADASIILNTFIPAMENAQQLCDGSWRIYGNFNLGGTQSLRLSSSKPNLQNIPSGSTYAKLIKRCFEPTPGWLFGGSDFDALEDKTGALLTKDPQRLKIYTDGLCGHNLRTVSYWPDKMPNIVKGLEKAKLPGKFYKVVLDSGIVQYLHESDTNLKEYRNGSSNS